MFGLFTGLFPGMSGEALSLDPGRGDRGSVLNRNNAIQHRDQAGLLLLFIILSGNQRFVNLALFTGLQQLNIQDHIGHGGNK